MIKFFRHIRKSLLMENKTSKYFKYAIGEIVLVIVGILIALQINTWNENRIAQSRIDSRMENLILDIESDIVEMEGIMRRSMERALVEEAILKGCGRFEIIFFDTDTIFPTIRSKDTLNPNASIGWLKTMDGNRATYDGLVSSGEFHLIKVQALARDIQRYYAKIDEHKDAERWNNQETWLIINRSKHRLGLGSESKKGTMEKLIELATSDQQFGAELEHAYGADVNQYVTTKELISQAMELVESIRTYKGSNMN